MAKKPFNAINYIRDISSLRNRFPGDLANTLNIDQSEWESMMLYIEENLNSLNKESQRNAKNLQDSLISRQQHVDGLLANPNMSAGALNSSARQIVAIENAMTQEFNRIQMNAPVKIEVPKVTVPNYKGAATEKMNFGGLTIDVPSPQNSDLIIYLQFAQLEFHYNSPRLYLVLTEEEKASLPLVLGYISGMKKQVYKDLSIDERVAAQDGERAINAQFDDVPSSKNIGKPWD